MSDAEIPERLKYLITAELGGGGRSAMEQIEPVAVPLLLDTVFARDLSDKLRLLVECQLMPGGG